VNHDELSGEIFISPNNRMTAHYSLYGVEDSDILTEISTVRYYDEDRNTEITIRVEDESIKNTEIDVKYRGNSEVYVEIQPMGYVNIPAEIEVRPNNRMWALYEVQEPPRITSISHPIQDSFTRSSPQYQSINYGRNNSLSVGRSNGEIYESFIRFDFAKWQPQYVVIDSKLRLYYSGLIPSNAKLELFTVNQSWQEYGITHLNKPSAISHIVSSYTNNPAKQYIEFEFTDAVNEWTNKNIDNHGFIVRLADDSNDYLLSFRSNESNRNPELIITYYDGKIYSAGRSQVPTEIFVWNARNSDTLTEVEVGSVIGNSDTPTEIYVHRYEDPVDNDIFTEIVVSKPSIYTEIEVWIKDESDVFTSLTVRSEEVFDEKETVITVSKPNNHAEIYVAYSDTIDTELIVRKTKNDDMLTEISITREQIVSEIYVKHNDSINTEIIVQVHPEEDILTEITITRDNTASEVYIKYPSITLSEISIQGYEDSTLLTDLFVTRESIATEILVKSRSNILTEITVQRHEDNDKLTEIFATREAIHTEIRVRAIENNQIDAEVYVRALGYLEAPVEIKVTRDTVLAEINVVESSDIDAEIYIKHVDDIMTEITVTIFDEVLTEIDVIAASIREVELIVSKPDVLTTIMIPYWDDSDIVTSIQPRIFNVDDTYTEIICRVKSRAYTFIM
jgi:hypothetical protein